MRSVPKIVKGDLVQDPSNGDLGLVLSVGYGFGPVSFRHLQVAVLWPDGAIMIDYLVDLQKVPQDGAADGHHPLKKSGQK